MSKTKKVEVKEIEQTAEEKLESKINSLNREIERKKENLSQIGQQAYSYARKSLSNLKQEIEFALADLERSENSDIKEVEQIVTEVTHKVAWAVANSSNQLNTANRKVIEYKQIQAEIRLFDYITEINKEKAQLFLKELGE